jgi:hypothetical protein
MPSDRTLTARIGGLALHIRHDSREIAARARRGLEAKFVREALEIDPELQGRALDQKVGLIKKLYYTRLAQKSSKSRSRKNRYE